ncbi:MAG: UDP-glucose 4-epimerase GalE [Flavobacteriales bacterium MED-G15]|nr:MAG: UDP-glucose 4-epimerase GalE [Flavobacteriales bacterium MED-G15]
MSTSKILVTGGLGYIGSHTCVELIEKGFEVVIVDDLSNSSINVLDGIKKIINHPVSFIELDLRNKDMVDELFNQNPNISGVIHFAASKAVGESVLKPLEYYDNNIGSLVNLLQAIERKGTNFPFIFSSSCTVYGQADQLPIDENAPIKKAESPYGNTKQIGEEILKDASLANKFLQVIALRYFNPIGAHNSCEIGELPIGKPQNLVPFITQTAAGIHKKLSVFGDDYPTEDGTCVRDYIHVVDLAKAHVMGLQRMISKEQDESFEVFNLGTGKGNSVLEVIKTFEKVSGQPLNYEITARRKGDVVAAYADTTKANKILGWKAQYTLEQALNAAWKWEKKIRKL